MNDSRSEMNIDKGKTSTKEESNNIFLSNFTDKSKAHLPSKNVFLLPNEEERNRTNHLHNKITRFSQGSLTFSDYSTDDAIPDISDNKSACIGHPNNFGTNKSFGANTNGEKADEDDDESSFFMHKKTSAQSIGPLLNKSRNIYNSSNSEDDIFDEFQVTRMRKLNSHQAIQSTGTNLLSESLRSKINSSNCSLKTFHLVAKRKYRDTGKSAYYIFTDGERTIFNIYQNNQQANLFEVYTESQSASLFSSSSLKVKSMTYLPQKSTTEIHDTKSKTKSTQIQAGKSITNASLNTHVTEQIQPLNLPVATLHMVDNKGSQFLFYKNDTNGELILKIQYIKTNFTGIYRSTVVTFHKNDHFSNHMSHMQSASSSSFSLTDVSDSESAFTINDNKKQRLWSKQPPLNQDGNPAFVSSEGRFFIESIRNFNLCKKNHDKIFISVRKTDQNELEIDAFFKANLLWLVGIALSDALSSVY